MKPRGGFISGVFLFCGNGFILKGADLQIPIDGFILGGAGFIKMLGLVVLFGGGLIWRPT